MKVIENKKIKLQNADESSTYGELLKACVSAPNQEGFTIDDIEKRLRIRKAIGETEIELEDADYAIAMQCIQKMRWGVCDEVILDFNNDFKAAENSAS